MNLGINNSLNDETLKFVIVTIFPATNMKGIKLQSLLWAAALLHGCLAFETISQERVYQEIGGSGHSKTISRGVTTIVPRGGGWIPAGYHPFGYKITTLGEEFLKYDGSLDSDVGRFLASLKSSRKTVSALKAQWLEILRVSKQGQTMRIYRQLQDLLNFCLKSGFVD